MLGIKRFCSSFNNYSENDFIANGVMENFRRNKNYKQHGKMESFVILFTQEF